MVKKIELVSLDDKFDTKIAAKNARKLIEEQNRVAMFLTCGAPNTEALIGHLNLHGALPVGPTTAAIVLHQPVHKHVFNVRAAYQRAVEKAMLYLASTGITRIALIHISDSFGADGAAGAQKGLKVAQPAAVFVEQFHRNKPDFAPIAPKLIASNAQAALMIASGRGIAQGLKIFVRQTPRPRSSPCPATLPAALSKAWGTTQQTLS